MKIIKSGTLAWTSEGKIKGMVTACCIRYGKVSYEFSYFKEFEYIQIWLNPNELTTKSNHTTKIGYR